MREASTGPVETGKAIDLSGKQFLVVDDQLVMRNLVCGILRSFGTSRVREAADVESALTLLTAKGARFDCVISDIVMSPRNGLELAKAIRVGYANLRHDIPIVLLTGVADSSFVKLAVDLDVNGFVVKPVSPQGLASRLNQIFTKPPRIKPPQAYGHVIVTVDSAMPRAASA
ncbi:MAG: response regulator [Azospirillum sp.]|nr:response regulator [Azospirillum sp.]